MYETHSHTPLCKHAIGEPEEYAAAALEARLEALTVTCHNPMPNDFSPHVRMSVDEFEEYVDLVARAREAFEGRLDILLGMECDYFPGFESWLEQQIASADFHYILGSVHPQIYDFRKRFGGGSAIELQRAYFDQLAVAAETGLFDCLSHPDLIKNETVNEWDPEAIWPDILRVLDRIAATGIAMELNTSGKNKRIAEMNPFPEMLKAMCERSIPVVIGADAHQPERVGDNFLEALELLDSCGFSEVHCFRERQRQAIAIAEARESLSGQLQ